MISLIFSLSEDHGIRAPQMFVSGVSLADFRNSAVSFASLLLDFSGFGALGFLLIVSEVGMIISSRLSSIFREVGTGGLLGFAGQPA